ncbi:unnamed protein product [Darwinula stevensoni]|uniref:E3 ubiquitin-protein ligase Hakai n=1 Tax=Darwinula stevensoni TaxID=69355 RepID=A0A7R8XIJ8_9CRUS|nr:unnamed protein product [Darwinula stevensoni]CAG0893494.1 unnamed protein product [Darwinula stevensoni]
MEEARSRGRGRPRGRGRGRTKSKSGGSRNVRRKVKDEEDLYEVGDDEQLQQEEPQEANEGSIIEMDDVLLEEVASFSMLDRGKITEAMKALSWDHRINLIGEKVLNPMIHCCGKCFRPILIYGRMASCFQSFLLIPCKHVFCLACSQKEKHFCGRCKEKVDRIEHAGLGSIYMCTHGGTRYGTSGCRRTYMSPRDLQAHFNHRHVRSNRDPSTSTSRPPPQPSSLSKTESKPSPADMTSAAAAAVTATAPRMDPRNAPPPTAYHHPMHHYPSPQQPSPIPVLTSRTSNLITVPIQDSTPVQDVTTYHHPYSKPTPVPPAPYPQYTLAPSTYAPTQYPPPPPSMSYPPPPHGTYSTPPMWPPPTQAQHLVQPPRTSTHSQYY